jgi:hypothetical protein
LFDDQQDEETNLKLSNKSNSDKKSKFFSNLAIEICTDEEDETNSNQENCFYYSENSKNFTDSINKPTKLKHKQSKKDLLDFIYSNSSSKMPGMFASHFLDGDYKKISNKYNDIIGMFSDSNSEIEYSMRRNKINNNILNYNPYVLTNINFDDTISDQFVNDLQIFNIYGPVR